MNREILLALGLITKDNFIKVPDIELWISPRTSLAPSSIYEGTTLIRPEIDHVTKYLDYILNIRIILNICEPKDVALFCENNFRISFFKTENRYSLILRKPILVQKKK